MAAPLDHTGPLDAVEDPGLTLLEVLVLLVVRALLVARLEVEVRRLGLLGPFDETTR